LPNCGPGSCSQYSDLLRAGRSQDRIQMRVRFSTPIQAGPGTHLGSSTIGTESLSRGKRHRGLKLTTYPYLVPGLKKEHSYTSSPPLGLRGLFLGEIYLFTFTCWSVCVQNVSIYIVLASSLWDNDVTMSVLLLGCGNEYSCYILTSFLTYLFTYQHTYLLNYLLTYSHTYSMKQWPSWEANRFSASLVRIIGISEF
jgi:hypothetical protein